MEDRCICYGEIIPEGQQTCLMCEENVLGMAAGRNSYVGGKSNGKCKTAEPYQIRDQQK